MAKIDHLIAAHIPAPVPSPEEQLRSCMISNGQTPPDSIILDGILRRYDDSKPGGDALWYVAFDTGIIPGGCFGSWRSGTNIPFRGTANRQLSMQEEMAYRSAMETAKARKAAEKWQRNEEAAEDCQEIWDKALPISPDFPYLKRKGIQPHVARLSTDARMIVPLYDAEGVISSLQYIDTSGGKLYHAGGATKGRFCPIGGFTDKPDRIYFAEGYATAVTIHEIMGGPVVVCYSAGNIEPTAAVFRARYPMAEFVIVADNDRSGGGKNHADQAAAKHGATVIMPPEEDTDANDYHLAGNDLHALLMPTPNGADMVAKLKAVFGDELSEEYEAPDEVVQGLIVAKAQTVIYGDSNSGKTFFALSLGYAVSEGVSCYSRMTDGGLVVYLATEAPGSIRARMQALKKFHGAKLSKLVMVPVPLNFHSNATDASDVIRLVEQVSHAKNMPVRMIIADTLARMSAGANENSGEDMGPVMDRFSMVAEHTGAAVVIIHHSGKDQARGARGWSGIRAHIDTEIEVEESDGTRFAKVTKQRELSSKGDEIAFELQVVEMGVSKFGAEVTTCVAIPSDGEKPVKLDRKTREHHRILKAAFEASGMDKLDGHPYITRSAMIQYLIDKEGRNPSTASKFLQEGEGRFIGGLIIAGTVRPQGNGWIVTDPGMASVMNILASTKGLK